MVDLKEGLDYFDRSLVHPLKSSVKEAFTSGVYGRSFIDGAKFIGQNARENQVTIITDPDHGDMTRRSFKASKPFMDELKKAGVTHLATETPKSEQVIIDALYSGKINKSTFVNIYVAREDSGIWKSTGISADNLVRSYEYVADTIINARMAGIKIIALDHKIGRLYLMKDGTVEIDGEESFDKKIYPDIVNFAANSPYFNPEKSTLYSSDLMMFKRRDLFKEWYKEHPAYKDFVSRASKVIDDDDEQKTRLTADPFLAFDVVKLVSQGGKVVVDYGIGHTLRQKGDLDSTLRSMGVKTKVIDLYGSRICPGDGTDIYKRWNERDDISPSDRIKMGLEKPYSRDSILLEDKKIIDLSGKHTPSK